MKKFSWIFALVAALAMVFVGCDDGGGDNGSVNWATEDITITDAAAIGALLSSTGWNGHAGGDVSTAVNVAKFAIPQAGSSDNQGFRLDFPPSAVAVLNSGKVFSGLEVTFKVTAATSIPKSGGVGNAKIGFKSGLAGPDVTPYDAHEIVFGPSETALNTEKTQRFSLYKPNKLDQNLVYFSHNKYGPDVTNPDYPVKKGSDSADGAIAYELTITKIRFVAGEAKPCCTDCNRDTCKDCADGACTDQCGTVCCLPPFTLEALKALTGGFTVGVGGEDGGVPAFDATSKVVSFDIKRKDGVEPPSDPSANPAQSTRTAGFFFTWEQAGIAAQWAAAKDKNLIQITYAAVVDTPVAKITVKKGNDKFDGTDLAYLDISDTRSSTVVRSKAQIGGDADGLTMSHNNWREHSLAQYHIKVLSVEVLACLDCGQNPCVCLACNCFCAACIAAGNCGTPVGANCAAGCECDCHYWDSAENRAPFTVALNVPTGINVNFPSQPGDASQNAAMAKVGDNLTFTYTANTTTGFIAFSADQVSRIQDIYKYGGKVVVNIAGSGTGTGATFRSCIGDVTKGSGWNATGWIGGGAGLAASALFGDTNALNGNNSDLKHLLIQCQAVGSDATVITISGVTITPVAP